MARGALYILFHQKSPPLGLEDARTAFQQLASSFSQGFLMIHDAENEADVAVSFDDGPHVKEESAEMADDYAAGRPHHYWVAACDARFVLNWDLQEVDLLFAMIPYLQETLEALT